MWHLVYKDLWEIHSFSFGAWHWSTTFIILMIPFRAHTQRSRKSFAHHIVLINNLPHPCFYNLVTVPKYVPRLNLCVLQVLQLLWLGYTARKRRVGLYFYCSRRMIIQTIFQPCMYLTLLLQRGSVDCSVQMQCATILCLPNLLSNSIEGRNAINW